MQDDQFLDAYLQDYYQKKIDKRKLEGIIFEFLRKKVRPFYERRWGSGDYLDFLCWFYFRIGRGIDRYRYSGVSFDLYILSVARMSAREYHRVQREHHTAESTYWDAVSQDTIMNREPSYLDDKPGPFRPVNNPRQTLILLLKSYYYVSEDFLSRAAPAMGMDQDFLWKLIEEMRVLRAGRDEKIQELRDRIHSQYYRCMTFEKRLAVFSPGSSRYTVLEERLARGRNRLHSMQRRLCRIRTGASNRQVAQVLGIPKGTIDSSMAAIKARKKRSLD
ncbi:MAG: hypothetical protein LBT11_00160 [Treponema sp.]|jgi:hypothetical protein|nr:hypothetical protein [Treponema sp.]